jgi:Lrp/AsnC family transcriptional regulator, leucine-responsive regulatory protein
MSKTKVLKTPVTLPAPSFPGYFTLDVIDRGLLAALSLDARSSLTELADRLGTSKQVVSYRLKALEKGGVIKGFHAIPNVYALGKIHYRVFVKFQHLAAATEKELIEYLRRCREIAWLTLLDGDFDLEFVIWAGDVSEFETVYDAILARFGSYFQEKYFSIATRVEYLPYRFLTGQVAGNPLIFGGPLGEARLDELDKKILTCLNRDGRLALAQLAASCQVAVPLARARLDQLIERRIILGFGLKIDHNQIGFTYRKVLLKLNHHSADVIARLSDFLRRLDPVIFLVKTIGTYDFEFEMMNESNREFYTAIKHIRSAFAAEIKLHQTVVVYDELKFGQLRF